MSIEGHVRGATPPLPMRVSAQVHDSMRASAPHRDDQVSQIVSGERAPPALAPHMDLQALREGGYLLQWTPPGAVTLRYDGVMRIQRPTQASLLASGDLYRAASKQIIAPEEGGGVRLAADPGPHPGHGLPVFARKDYRYYLSVVEIVSPPMGGDDFTMRFERHAYDLERARWREDGLFRVDLRFEEAPPGYPAGAVYCAGQVEDEAGRPAGLLSMGWVSPYLRRAVIEIDRVPQSEFPRDNGEGRGWRDIFDEVGWDVEIIESDEDVKEPGDQSWSSAEMHAAMLKRRDTDDIDSEWRYYLLCVRRIDGGSLGIMFDNSFPGSNGDSNKTPREGAGIASHVVYSRSRRAGRLAGKRLGETSTYFRTAVHEIGHAMGLYHNIDRASSAIMSQTGVVMGNARLGEYPDNVVWSFEADDRKRLRHMPDPWVRPGMTPFGRPYSSAPISPDDALEVKGLTLEVAPLLAATPYGAPVRLGLTLTNHLDVPCPAPADLGLDGEHLSGVVISPGGARRGFSALYLPVDSEEPEERLLAPGESLRCDVTLLGGQQGALFAEIGQHRVEMRVDWLIADTPAAIKGSAQIMVGPPIDAAHAHIAAALLGDMEAFYTLVLHGDHMEEGVKAIKNALTHPVLRPHYAVIEAKRLARKFFDRKADLKAAAALIDENVIMTRDEACSMIEIIARTKEAGRSKAPFRDAIEAVEKIVATLPDSEALLDAARTLK